MSPKSTPHRIFNRHDQGARILNGTKCIRVRCKVGLSRQEPLAMELITCIMNACKIKGRHWATNKIKVAVDLPIMRFLVGGWRTGERTIHHMEHHQDEFHETLEEQLINVWNTSWSITSMNS